MTLTEDSVYASIQRVEDYIEKTEGGLITAIRNDTNNTMDNRMTITRKQKWEEKQLIWYFKRLINNISHDKTGTWLRKRHFQRESEYLLILAQNNAVRSNHIEARVDKKQQKINLGYAMRDETTNHTIGECSKLAQ